MPRAPKSTTISPTPDGPLKPYYVYVLADPRKRGDAAVFYVGKGTGGRVLAHGALAKKLENEAHDSARLARISEIAKAGKKVLELVVARVDTEIEAHRLETLLIDWVYGRERLTNLQGGHGHRYVRRRGDLAQVPYLDVEPRTGEHTGEYTQGLQREMLGSDTMGQLTMWRALLLEPLTARGLRIGPVDLTSNKTAPHVVITLPEPFVLHLVMRPNWRQGRVNLTFTAPSPAMAAAFMTAAQRSRLNKEIVGQRVRNPGPKAYFYLTRYPPARKVMHKDVATVLEAIDFLMAITKK